MTLADHLSSSDEFTPTKVLVIVAHPDDIDFGTAGTVAILTDHPAEVIEAGAQQGGDLAESV